MSDLVAELDAVLSDLFELRERMCVFRDSLSESINELTNYWKQASELHMVDADRLLKMRINDYEKNLEEINLTICKLERERVHVVSKIIELTEPSVVPKNEDKCKMFLLELQNVKANRRNAESRNAESKQ